MTPHKKTGNIVTETLNSWAHEIIGDFKYAKEILIALIIGGIVAGGYYGYRWHTRTKSQAAHILFSQNLEEFDRASQENRKEDWASIETLFKLGYDQYPHSSLAPYFLMYQAQAMLKQNKLDDAITTMEKSVSLMPSDSPVLGLYKAKIALMKLDSKNTDAQASALEQLQTLAHDKGNPAQDVAGYHLGLYYFANHNNEKAKEVWTALIQATEVKPHGFGKQLGQSPWAAQAQAKLEQIQ